MASIAPKNYVLPFLKQHFCSRFACENFLIYDKTHRAALVYRDGLAEIVELEQLETPAASDEELAYRALWQRFYKTVSIAARENPRCRMTHMPKRYWECMLEVRDELRRVSEPRCTVTLPQSKERLLPLLEIPSETAEPARALPAAVLHQRQLTLTA